MAMEKPGHTPTPLEDWRAACSYPIQCLESIVARRLGVVQDLVAVGKHLFTEDELTDMAFGVGSSDSGVIDPDLGDTTHHLANTTAWLNAINAACTKLGVEAVGKQLAQAKNGIENLRDMDRCFVGDPKAKVRVHDAEDGTPQYCDADGAWSYLRNNVEPYLLGDREKEIQADIAGYRGGSAWPTE